MRTGSRRPQATANEPHEPLWPSRLVAISAAAVYVILWIAGYFAADLTCDGNLYHLPAVHFWIHAGRICWIDDGIPAADLMNGFPKGIELMAFVVAKATHCSHFANTTNLLFLPLGVVGLMYLATALGALRGLALFAGAAWVLLPVNVFQATVLYVDSGYAVLRRGLCRFVRICRGQPRRVAAS